MLLSHVLLFLSGIVMILLASHFFVKYACIVGRALNWPDTLTGIIILGIGTSTPEIMISLYSHLTHHDGLLLGNILGSNIANSLLVVGAALLAASSEALTSRHYRYSYWVMIILSLVLAIAIYFQSITLLTGVILLVLAIASFLPRNHESVSTHKNKRVELKTIWHGVCILILLGIIFLSAQMTVEYGLSIAKAMRLQESTFGALFIAISTSLPEIAVVIIAASQKQLSLVFSTVLGSNIANIGFAIGLSAIIHPILVPSHQLLIMSWIALAASALIWLWIKTASYVNKTKGILLLLTFAGFAFWATQHQM